MSTYTKEDLVHLKPRHATLVGIDSDGCVFPTMDIKQKKCFHAAIIKFWGLEKIEKQVRETAEFVSLHSKWRGVNRFPALVMIFDLLLKRPDVKTSGVKIAPLNSLRRYVGSGVPLSNATLEEAAVKSDDPELKKVLDWSKAVNQAVERTVKNVTPYKWVRESLDKISRHSDILVVSQTPEEALIREWQEHGIDQYAEIIAGQELGTKIEHLELASRGKYAKGQVLMIGDAQGDLNAARKVGACFFPIKPGHEEISWKLLYEEAFDRFVSGQYSADYEKPLIDEFEALLPDVPPWEE